MDSFHTLMLSMMLITLLMAGVFVLAYLALGRIRHSLFFAGAFVAGGLKWGVYAFPQTLPGGTALAVLLAALAVLAGSLTLIGLLSWAGRRELEGAWWTTGAIAFTGLAAMALWSGSPSWPMVLIPAYSGLMHAACALVVLRRNYESRPVEKALGGAFLLVAAANLSGAVSALNLSLSGAVLTTAGFDQSVAMPAACLIVGMLTLLLFASDLAAQSDALARTDTLTGVLNRRGFDDATEPMISRERRSTRMLAILVLDLDHFKQINDRFGHAAGDRVLATLGAFLQKTSRHGDVVARIGGEEFALVLPATPLDGAVRLGERLCLGIRELDLRQDGERLPVTISLGVSFLDDRDRSMEDLLARADVALRQAKADGGNGVRTHIAAPALVEPVAASA